MALFVPSEQPKSKLGHLRQLSKRAGAHVSPFQLGGMSIGESSWAAGMGQMNKEMSFKLLDTFYEQGGNFIDTAGNYQDGTSEKFIGEWAEARGIRDELVIATKYSTNTYLAPHSVNRAAHTGNSAKSLRNTVENSLKDLRTSYIDILYLHWWDWDTSVEEIMDALHSLVQRGIVLYLGVSDTPAWVVARANEYARRTGKTPFAIYQTMYSIMERSAEREILPFVRDEGMAFAPFGVLCGGKLRSDEEEEKRRKTDEKGRNMPWMGGWERTPEEKKVCDALEKVRAEVGAKSITSVAIAYVLHKAPFVFPILGGRKPEQLVANVEALDIALTDEQIAFLDGVKPLDVGFPNFMIGDGKSYPPGLCWSTITKVPGPQPIRPSKHSAAVEIASVAEVASGDEKKAAENGNLNVNLNASAEPDRAAAVVVGNDGDGGGASANKKGESLSLAGGSTAESSSKNKRKKGFSVGGLKRILKHKKT